MAAAATDFYLEPVEMKPSGFSFSNCARNAALQRVGLRDFPKVRKSGTTIVAVVFKDGVIMGADCRATQGDIISDKAALKVHRLTDSIYACGAGTMADLDQVMRMISAQLNLWELNTGRKARVVTANRIARQHLFKYQGYVGAYLLIGGMDITGPKLAEVHASGTTSVLPYDADGSGSLAAMAVLELEYKENMTEDECIALVSKALQTGMHGDLASGNAYRYVIIRKDSTELRSAEIPQFCKLGQARDLKYRYEPKATTVLKEKRQNYEVIEKMEVE